VGMGGHRDAAVVLARPIDGRRPSGRGISAVEPAAPLAAPTSFGTDLRAIKKTQMPKSWKSHVNLATRWLPTAGESQPYVFSIARRDLGTRHAGVRKGRRARARPLRPKGSTLREKAAQLVKAQGCVTTGQLQAIGVHRCYLAPMCREGLLVRVRRGLYRAPDR
jgi:hypothetical protein